VESFHIYEGWHERLARAGLDSFDALFSCSEGEVFSEKPWRVTMRIALEGAPTGHVFIKRFHRVPWRRCLKRLFSLSAPKSCADEELANISRLEAIGIESFAPVAFGWRMGFRGLWEQSFFVTDEVAGGMPADRFAAENFSGSPDAQATSAKRRLVRSIAAVARRLHRAGLNHRDFYLCHIFIRPVAGADPVIHLLDLGRVMRHSGPRRMRWLIKDIAALDYSAAGLPFSTTDRLRFMKTYFGVGKLGASHKRFIRRALAKSRRIARHDAKLLARPQGDQEQ